MLRSICSAAVLLVCIAANSAMGADTGSPADAAMNGDLSAMYASLKAGADPNGHGAFGTPPLHWRVRVDDLEAAKRLLAAGADPN